MSEWSEYYKGRNSASYRKYFEKKYHRFVEIVESQGKCFFEAGCGIGTVSKILKSRNAFVEVSGCDIDLDMMTVGKLDWNFVNADITESYAYCGISKKVIHSHGVLEHFSVKDIKSLIYIQKATECPMVHWVPTKAYKTQSFGDKLLLCVSDWVNLLKPDTYCIVDKGLIALWNVKTNCLKN